MLLSLVAILVAAEPAPKCPEIPARFGGIHASLFDVEKASLLHVRIEHSEELKAPRRLAIKDVEMLGTKKTKCGLVAEVRTDSRGMLCPGYECELKVGTSLGGDNQVIAILSDTVLLRTPAGIAYVSSRRQGPVFEMVWRADWTMEPYVVRKGGGRSSSGGTTTKKAKRKKSTKK